MVLVIAYQAFTLDRANPVVGLFGLVEEKFHRIFKEDNESFYILITKCPLEVRKREEAFGNHLTKLCMGEKANIMNLKTSDPTHIELDYLR